MKIALRKVTADTVRSICDLSVSDNQKSFVAPNAVSIAQAYFYDFAWFRAIYSDDKPVGFVMLSDRPELPEYYLWRFMIDKRYQNKGYGKQAIELLVDYVKSRPKADVLWTSVIQSRGGPQKFYEKQGFKLTGEYKEGEALMTLELT
ncbi:GNAT family N-acetyltransferase [Candidatus Neomarinimicrobiota bacterium]